MDSNNFPANCGVGEREGRIYSRLVDKDLMLLTAESFYDAKYWNVNITSKFIKKLLIFSSMFLLSNLKYISNRYFQDKM